MKVRNADSQIAIRNTETIDLHLNFTDAWNSINISSIHECSLIPKKFIHNSTGIVIRVGTLKCNNLLSNFSFPDKIRSSSQAVYKTWLNGWKNIVRKGNIQKQRLPQKMHLCQSRGSTLVGQIYWLKFYVNFTCLWKYFPPECIKLLKPSVLWVASNRIVRITPWIFNVQNCYRHWWMKNEEILFLT